MDIYGMSSSGQDFSGVDELLDFSNDHDDVICTSNTTDILHHQHNMITSSSSTANACHFQYGSNNNDIVIATDYINHHSTDFTDDLCVPSNEVAELEWLSNFVHDSLSDFPENNMIGTINFRPDNPPFHSRSRSKRNRAPANTTSWTSPSQSPLTNSTISEKTMMKLDTYSSPASSSGDGNSEADIVRRCTHCASEKTPQWRTGPLGPKTLCNACGVRYKSGRLVPEYRPAASPTFVLTQHSNSHRKVMELRRQKEMMIGQPRQSRTDEYQIYGGAGHQHHHHHHSRNNYEVC